MIVANEAIRFGVWAPVHGPRTAWRDPAALIQRIDLIAAIKPPLLHPMILAKMALQIENISGGLWSRPRT